MSDLWHNDAKDVLKRQPFDWIGVVLFLVTCGLMWLVFDRYLRP